MKNKLLTPAERRAIIEAPWPDVKILNGKSWGGIFTQKPLLVPWPRKGAYMSHEEDANDD